MFNKLSKNTKETVENYIQEFDNLYTYVHDYFENLDVQEEIDHKIDELVSNGTMQEIVEAVLQPSKAQYTYDSVSAMFA